MRHTFLSALLLGASVSLCLGSLRKRVPGLESDLLGRGLPVASANCTRHSTCDECFGDGYVVCDNAGCFNPDEGQRCCKGAYLCVAWDDGCCDSWGGAGKTGTSGTVPIATATTSSALPESSEWSCTRFQGTEDCCQGGGPDMHWCAEEFPNTVCYNSTVQICCSEGTVCEGKNCCDLVSASQVTPWATLGSAKESASSGTATATATTGEESETTMGTTTATADTASSTGAAARAMVTPFVKGLAGFGAIGMGLIL